MGILVSMGVNVSELKKEVSPGYVKGGYILSLT
jgi:hypothetical protein